MKRVLFWAIVAGAAYLAYTELLPRYEQYQAREEAEVEADQEAELARRCVATTDGVFDSFSSQLLRVARPPVDPATWSTIMIQTSGELSSADSACRCSEPACASAAAALLELRRLLNQLDSVVRGRAGGSFNPATSLEQAQRLLERARAESR